MVSIYTQFIASIKLQYTRFNVWQIGYKSYPGSQCQPFFWENIERQCWPNIISSVGLMLSPQCLLKHLQNVYPKSVGPFLTGFLLNVLLCPYWHDVDTTLAWHRCTIDMRLTPLTRHWHDIGTPLIWHVGVSIACRHHVNSDTTLTWWQSIDMTVTWCWHNVGKTLTLLWHHVLYRGWDRTQ